MRSLPPPNAPGIASLITITRGLTVLRFTTADHPVTINGNTFIPAAGAAITKQQFPSDGSPANADVTIMVKPDGIIQPGDGVRGVLDGWPITIEEFDLSNPDGGSFPVLSGTIGGVDEDTLGMATIAVDGALRLAGERPLTEQYALTGREDLGDDRCKIPLCADQDIAAFDIGRGQEFVRPDVATGLQRVADAYGRARKGSAGTVEDYANLYLECTTDGTTDPTTPPDCSGINVGDSVTDGSAVFVVRNAWTRYARGYALDPFTIQITTLVEPRSADATWFLLGGLFFRSGALAGFPKSPIRAWNPSTLQATLFLPVAPSDVPADTQMEIHAGCNLTRGQCQARFGNIVNLRAETFVPPPDLRLSL